MILYHGTSARHLPSILSEGLRPRGRRKGNWSEYPSRRDMVYATKAYAPYFGIQALDDKSDNRVLIVEIDVDESNLYPDEDFIAQALAHQRKCSIQDVHAEVRKSLEDYRHHWTDSVNGLGNAAHLGVIEPFRIRRLCTFDLSKQREMAMICDPQISVMNYRFCGERYRSVTAWFFGDRRDFLLGATDNAMHVAMMERHQPGYGEQVERLFGNRDGIEVFAPEEAAT